MRQLKFIFGTIISPPVHIEEEELEKIYKAAVFPFLNELYKYPEIKITLSFSGPFLEWIDKKHPEYVAVLSEMIKRKQVEILGGGFFQPLLPMLSHLDQLGQIESLTTCIRKILGRRPRGVWLTKGVWDSSLASTLKTAGMEFSFLEDSYFRAIRASNKEWCYPRITENQGKSIALFPYSNDLKEKIFSRDWEGVDNFFQNRIKKQNAFLGLLLPVDGSVTQDPQLTNFFQNGGLTQLLKIIRDYWNTLEPVHPGQFLRKNVGTLGKVYFSSSTYEDLISMGYSEDLSELPRGKQNLNFRHFLTLHNRSNLIYSKIIHTHVIVQQIRGDRYRKLSAQEELWKGEARECFTNWKDGGWKDYKVRTKTYSALIDSERIARGIDKFEPSLLPVDFDMDGIPELLFQSKMHNIYLDTKGGQFIEWDWLPSSWNFLSAYIPFRENAGLWNPGAFVDFALLEFPQKLSQDYEKLTSSECLFGQYRLEDLDRDQKKVALVSSGEIFTRQGRKSIIIRKIFKFTSRGVNFTVILDSPGLGSLDFVYGLENNWSFKNRSSKGVTISTDQQEEDHSLDSGLKLSGTKITIKDKGLGVQHDLTFSKEFRLECFPHYFGDYQGHVILPLWDLQPGEGPWVLEGEWSLQKKK